jgi:hypothetical protein
MPFEPKDNDNSNEVDIIDSILEGESSPASMGPGGQIFTPLAYDSLPMPDYTPENVICLRGPCKHYWEMKLFFESGNTEGTMPEAPKYTQRACLRQSGVVQNLNDDVVFECSSWEPMTKVERNVQDAAREEFYQENPQFRLEVKNA